MSKLSIFIVALSAFAAAPALAVDACLVRSGRALVPLVELYTSEGCSSCPPADRWLSQQVSRDDANWLAFHVDYWDDIGWPDRFASASYSQRQRQRVGAAGSTTVYTPQVMVGADVRAPWRTPEGFSRAIKTASGAAPVALALRLEPEKGALRVRLGAVAVTSPAGEATVWLAQYVDGQTTRVRAGENRGATLHHDRVVQHLWGPWRLDGTPLAHVQALPSISGKWGLVAFVQGADGRTLQSLALPADACVVDQARL